MFRDFAQKIGPMFRDLGVKMGPMFRDFFVKNRPIWAARPRIAFLWKYPPPPGSELHVQLRFVLGEKV